MNYKIIIYVLHKLLLKVFSLVKSHLHTKINYIFKFHLLSNQGNPDRSIVLYGFFYNCNLTIVTISLLLKNKGNSEGVYLKD